MLKSDKIVMMEDHDKAYHAWKERGIRDRVLVHVDAHIDFGWVPDVDMDEISSVPDPLDPGPPVPSEVEGWTLAPQLINPFLRSRKKMVNIGNYICPAIKDGMVKKFYWVVPDESFRARRGLKHITKQLEALLKIKSHAGGKIEIRKDSLHCHVLGKEVIVCGLNALESISEPVLLDIDTDFLVTRHIWDDLEPKRTPWISPEKLFKKLASKVADIDMLTISYSVEGGFTPLKFKHLGDDIKALFEGGVSGGNDASTYFNLCLSHMKTDIEKARAYYDKAVSLDKTYDTAYNNHGIIYLYKNRFNAAEEAYKDFLRLTGDDPRILSGLGYIALARKRYAKAANFFNRSLLADEKYREARFGKGIVAFNTGKIDEALKIFAGLKDDLPDEHDAYWWLGRIAEKKGDIQQTIDNYKDAVMRGGDGPGIHFRLCRLYVSKGMYFRAFEELHRAIKIADVLR
jgi:Tfp pilus assembly protein PilF